MAITRIVLMVCLPLFVAGQRQPLEGSVRQNNNRPTIFINSQPVSPQFYSLTHAYGARWSWEEVPSRNVKNFCQLGFKLFQVDLYFQDIWYEERVDLDISKAQKQIQGVLDVCEEAAIIIRIHVNAPYWWNEKNKDECTQYADAPVDTRSYGPPNDNENGDVDHPLRASLASLKWRKEASDRLVEFCQRLAATPQGNSVFGLHVSCGVYGEWHYWGFPNHDPDTGPAMVSYFRNWLMNKYKNEATLQKAWNDKGVSFHTITVPDKIERDTTTNGVFRNPQLERKVIDYYECQQYVVAEDIIHFCSIVKKSWPRPLVVGVFYNYFFMTFSRQAVGGHLNEQMILNSAAIDYLSAPQSYWGGARKPGGSGQSRGLVESANLHNKLWLDEMDQNTYKGGPFNAGFTTTREQDVAIIRRNLAQAITRGGGYWFYDFGPYRSSGWWDDTVLLSDISKQKKVLDHYYQFPFERKADVLFVYSNKVFYHIRNRFTPVTSYGLLDQQSLDAYQSGVSLDQVYIDDLPLVDLRKYKSIVFSNVFHLNNEQKRFIKEKVARDGRHVVWNYMPGYTNGSENNIRFVKEVTGMDVSVTTDTSAVSLKSTDKDYPLVENQHTNAHVHPFLQITDVKATPLAKREKTGEVVVAKKTFTDYTAWYSTYFFSKPEIFRRLFKSAGAHIYGDGNDVFHDDGRLLSVHTRSGGTKKIQLRNGKELTLETKPESTIYLDSNTGIILLQ